MAALAKNTVGFPTTPRPNSGQAALLNLVTQPLHEDLIARGRQTGDEVSYTPNINGTMIAQSVEVASRTPAVADALRRWSECGISVEKPW